MFQVLHKLPQGAGWRKDNTIVLRGRLGLDSEPGRIGSELAEIWQTCPILNFH